MSGFPLDLEPLYMLIITHRRVSDIPKGTMTVPGLTIKIKEWVVVQFPETPVLP